MIAPWSDEPHATHVLEAARARIAHELLDAHRAPSTIGDVQLYPHQQRAVSRLMALLTVANGAMLADATGLGKTFVALAVARQFQRTLIITPASLVEAWRAAASRTGVSPTLTSMEMISRRAIPPNWS